MVKSQRISLVVDMAKKKEEKAASALAKCKEQYDSDKHRYLELCKYYDSYEQSQLSKSQAIAAQSIEKVRLFLQQLNVAKRAQEYQMQVVEKEMDEINAAWRQCYLERVALEGLVERLKCGERLNLDKQEQKMLDDWFNTKQQMH